MNSDTRNPEGYLPANDQQKWNQSYYFNFYDPKSKIGALLRIGILENLKEVNAWTVFFMDGTPIFTRVNMNLPYTADRIDKGMDVAGMRVTSIETLRKCRVQVSCLEFSADLIFEQTCPMSDAVAMSAGVSKTFSENLAAAHLEGPSHVTGTVTVREKGVIKIDCTGFRDVAYGNRNWDGLIHYRLCWPVFSNGITVAVIRAISKTGESSYIRHVYDGKQWLGVKKMEDKLEFNEDRMVVKSLKYKVWDVNDRLYEFTGVPIFSYNFPMDTFCVLEHEVEFRMSDGAIGYGLVECGYRGPWAGNGT